VYGADPPRLRQLTIDEVQAHVHDDAALVDVRPIDAFAAGHIPGALSIALRPAFASWLGWLVPPEQPLVFVADPGQDRAALVRECLKIGYERLVGELEGGMASWREAGLPERRTESVPAAQVPRAPLLDVRQVVEYSAGHVPGALNIELGSLDSRVTDATAVATVMCGRGERAMSAASIIERAGGSPAVYLGGPRDWSRAKGLPLARGE